MIKALIFDFDGLILDTETPEFHVWQNIYREHGHELPAEKWASIVGGSGLSDFDAAKNLSLLTQGRLDSASLSDRFRLQLKKYYQQVISALKDANSILIIGPGEAKIEFEKALMKYKGLQNRVLKVETADKMTKNQMVAYVKRFYQNQVVQ